MTSVSFLLRFPYIFHLVFVAVLKSPLNKPAPYKVIEKREAWRSALYMSGIVMGFCYTCGFLCYIISSPTSGGSFAMCSGMTDTISWYMNIVVYTTGFPVGVAMMIFHFSFRSTRMGPREGLGCTLSNGMVLVACCLVQALYVAIVYNFISTANQVCAAEGGAFAHAPLTSYLTSAGNTIILLVWMLRLSIAINVFAVKQGDCNAYKKAYCGAGESELTWSQEWMDAQINNGAQYNRM